MSPADTVIDHRRQAMMTHAGRCQRLPGQSPRRPVAAPAAERWRRWSEQLSLIAIPVTL
jgi:hypothetical protein